MTQSKIDAVEGVVQLDNADGSSSIVLVCEHASAHIPAEFDHLGLPENVRQSHAVWDPGAMGVAQHLARRLDAALVAGAVSRLIYDCNRPPEAEDAMPARSEVIDVPGNMALSPEQRRERIKRYYEPFKRTLHEQIAKTQAPVVVTIHSFTPVFHGAFRSVEIGILHDVDARLADALIDTAPKYTSASVQRNQPYGPENGVTHTLKEHAIPGEHLNVMLEIRNDLIKTEADQREIADMIAVWLSDAFAQTKTEGRVKCVA